MEVEIILDRKNKTYFEGEDVKGVVKILCKGNADQKHEGVSIYLDGTVSIANEIINRNQGSGKSIPEGTISSPTDGTVIPILGYASELLPAGQISRHEKIVNVPFQLPITSKSSIMEEWSKDEYVDVNKDSMLETYHGVRINIQYNLKVEIKRGMLQRDIIKCQEIYLENRPYRSLNGSSDMKSSRQRDANTEPINSKDSENTSMQFVMSPDTIKKKRLSKNKDLDFHQTEAEKYIPDFIVKGNIKDTVCRPQDPFTGDIVVEKSELDIRSIELQLMRVEIITGLGLQGVKPIKESSEVQSIQIGDGDVRRNISLPIYMIFPRWFVSPTIDTIPIKVAFEMNITILFADNTLVTENIPLVLRR